MKPLRVTLHGQELGSIRTDRNFPHKLVNVCGPGERFLLGTPFAVLSVDDLRAWGLAFMRVAEELERRQG